MFLTEWITEQKYRSRKCKLLPHKMTFGERFIYDGDAASEKIAGFLKRDRPCLISRFGWVELASMLFFLRNCHRHTIHFREKQRHYMENNAGFLAPSDSNLARFCSESLEILDRIEVLGVTLNRGDETVLKTHGRAATLINLTDIGNIFLERQWLPELKGRKVLVIHPFADTIVKQYARREKLFPNPEFLPEFDLKVLKAVQSAGGTPCGFSDWFSALDSMCEEIRGIDFDVALIGAGAYGMFLGDFCKSLGKQAVHVGGSLQLFFGIIGKRWERMEPLIPASLPEENSRWWVRPSAAEQISGKNGVEESCYW